MNTRAWIDKLYLLAAVCACLTLCACGGDDETAQGPDLQAEYAVATVRDFPLAVRAKGELEAAEQVEIKVQVEGSTAISEIIPEGTAVEGPTYQMTSRGRKMIPGTLLATLGVEQIDEKIQEERLSVQQVRADAIAAEQEMSITISSAISSERAARVKLEQARLEQQKWESGTDPQKQRELKLALEKATRSLTQAERDLEDAKQLYEEKFISLAEKEDAEIALIEAKNALATAELNITVYDQFERPKEQQRVISDVEQAEAELARTLKKNEGDLARAKATLASKRGTLALREDRLEKLISQRRFTRIYAPRDGTVVYATSVGGRRRWSDPIRQGRQVRYNEPLIILPDTSRMIASIKVHEARIAQIAIGQDATIEIDARPGEPIRGKVIFKASNAEDPGWFNPTLREYIVRVELPSELDASLQPGMTCRGVILTGQVKDELSVPVQAVHTEGKDRFCYVPAGGDKWQRRPIEIGQSNESWVVVTEGLRPDDKVLLRNPQAAEIAQ